MMTHAQFIEFHAGLDRFRLRARIDPDEGPCLAEDPELDDAYTGLDLPLEALVPPEKSPPAVPTEPIPPSSPDLWDNTRWLNANAHCLTFQGEPVLEAWVVIYGTAVESCHENRALAHQHIKEKGWQGVAIIWRVTQTMMG